MNASSEICPPPPPFENSGSTNASLIIWIITTCSQLTRTGSYWACLMASCMEGNNHFLLHLLKKPDRPIKSLFSSEQQTNKQTNKQTTLIILEIQIACKIWIYNMQYGALQFKLMDEECRELFIKNMIVLFDLLVIHTNRTCTPSLSKSTTI